MEKSEPIYFSFGKAYHLFREHLERAWMNDPTISNANEYIIEATKKAVEYFIKNTSDTTNTTAPFLTTERLLKSCKKVSESWIIEKRQKLIEVLAVEQYFCVELPDGTFSTGRLDQLIKVRNRIFGRDFKTTQKLGQFYERTLDPNEQLTRYTFCESLLLGSVWTGETFSGQRLDGQYVELLYNTKNEGPKVITLQTNRTDFQLKEWLESTIEWNKKIVHATETNNFPMNEDNCRYCSFHSVCRLSSEAARLYQLKSHFKVEHWNPLKEEE